MPPSGYLAIYVSVGIFLIGTVGHLIMLAWFFGNFKGTFVTRMERVERDLTDLNNNVKNLHDGTWAKPDGEKEIQKLDQKVNATFKRIDDNATSIRHLEQKVAGIEAICGIHRQKGGAL